MTFPRPEDGALPRGDNPERDARIWKMRMIDRMTLEQIGNEVGLSNERVSQIMTRLMAKDALPTRDEMIRRSAEVMDSVHKRLEELAEKVKDGAPVTVGKDGTILYEPDPENPDGPGRVVRDYSGLRDILKEIRATDNDIAKRWGLNAPDRLETTLKGTVRYEIVDVGGDDLT